MSSRLSARYTLFPKERKHGPFALNRYRVVLQVEDRVGSHFRRALIQPSLSQPLPFDQRQRGHDRTRPRARAWAKPDGTEARPDSDQSALVLGKPEITIHGRLQMKDRFPASSG